jgi:3-oxoacyl-[acyl-carrier-protein] synthase II
LQRTLFDAIQLVCYRKEPVPDLARPVEMYTRRVAVTGIGISCALGSTLESFEEGLRTGRCGIRELTLFDPSGFRSRLAAQAPDPEPALLRDDLGGTSRPDRFGLVTAFDAVKDAGLRIRDLEQATIVFGVGTGGATLTENWLVAPQYDPASLRQLVPHQPCSATDLIARHLGLYGPRVSIMTACSSSATALGYGADRIRLGQAEVVLAGGCDALSRLTLAGFSALRATSPDPCRPFDVDRKGITLGEGAATLVLEPYERARARGAKIYALVAGCGISADAYHMTAPHPEGQGAARAMRAALSDAGIDPFAIGHINAHGTGTLHNDAAETLAIKTVFGPRAPSIPVTSIKSMVGHTLSAAGAIEAVTSILSLYRGFIPPTLNLENPDPSFGLDYVRGAARTASLEYVLSSSFAFGGNNTALIFKAAK